MYKINIQSGFTLLEALVAISILMVAVVAPITIAQKGLSSASYTKNQMIASYLAQDAMEYIKNRRDLKTINSTISERTDWLDGLEDCFVTSDGWTEDGCSVDTVEDNIKAYDSTEFLRKDRINKFYGHNIADDKTNFKRQVKIWKKEPNQEAVVKVTVSWGEGENKIDVYSLMFNF